MRAIARVLLASLAMGAFAESAASAMQEAATPASAQQCELPPGWNAVTRDDPRYIVFGESHGTVEGPALIGDVACALAANGERLLLAFELSSKQNDALQSAWRAPHDRFADTLLASMTDWRRFDGGVTSEAMLALLIRLHALKAEGAAIDVVAFNSVKDADQKARFADLPLQGPHEAAQAENISVAAEASRYDRVLVLVGSLHARRRPVEREGVAFESMAMRLARSGKVLSLELVYGDGAAWGCQLRAGATFVYGKPIDGADMSCASHPWRGRDELSGERRVGLWPTAWQNELDGAFDGYAWLGPAHASPPAVPGAGEISADGAK